MFYTSRVGKRGPIREDRALRLADVVVYDRTRRGDRSDIELYYDAKRLHSTLGYRTAREAYADYLNQRQATQ